MQSINALSLAPHVKDWLANTYNPRILHVFDHACNLVNGHREVLSIVTPEIGNGPFNLVIPGHRKSSERFSSLDESQQTSEVFSNINLQSPVSNSSTQLHLEDLTITTLNARLWSPRPDWERLHAKKDHIIKLLLTNYQARDLDTAFSIAQPYSTTTFDPTNYQFSNSLIASLAIADIPSSITSAKKLAGLGIGLTPACDDFIMGAILATWIIHPFKIASTLAREISNTAAPLTTSLSAAYLKSAGRGEAGILWHNFFNSLITNDSAAVELQIIKLLSIGETSGADALAGFIGTFISYAEMEKNHVIPKHI